MISLLAAAHCFSPSSAHSPRPAPTAHQDCDEVERGVGELLEIGVRHIVCVQLAPQLYPRNHRAQPTLRAKGEGTGSQLWQSKSKEELRGMLRVATSCSSQQQASPSHLECGGRSKVARLGFGGRDQVIQLGGLQEIILRTCMCNAFSPRVHSARFTTRAQRQRVCNTH